MRCIVDHDASHRGSLRWNVRAIVVLMEENTRVSLRSPQTMQNVSLNTKGEPAPSGIGDGWYLSGGMLAQFGC